MGSFNYSLSLWAKHPDAYLSDIPTLLKMPSNRAWKKGEIRKAPNGRIQGGVYGDSFCGMRIAHNETGKLIDALKASLKKLKTERELFRQESEGGVSFSFNIALFMNEPSCGELFDRDVLKDMADLGIALGLSIYAPDDEEGEASNA